MRQPGHLLILIGGHFANAPRPQKEAAVAVATGFRVTVMGTWTDEGLSNEDLSLAESLGVHFEPLLDLSQSSIKSLYAKFSSRIARLAYRRLGLTLPESFGASARMMLKEARRVNPDLIMVHSEAGLWAGRKLLQQGYKVGVDFEDWFSEDLPESARKARPVNGLKKLEHHLLHHAHLSVTTTKALSNALTQFSGCKRAPLTIPNTFPIVISDDRTRDARTTQTPVKFYWFSQTIGPGRGLEELAKALAQLTGSWELHLRGNLRHYADWYEATFSAIPPNRIIVHPTVPNENLSQASSSFDVGLALEDSQVRNRDLTATNKIFEYLRSRLAIIATDTKGQVEVMVQCPEAGIVITGSRLEELVNALQFYIDDRAALALAKRAAFEAASTTWAWSRFAPQLAKSLESASRSSAC